MVGGCRFGSPWQAVHSPPPPLKSTVPLMWRPPPVLMVPSGLTVPPWQREQLVVPLTAGCGGGGGMPWHVPQSAWPAFTLFQIGLVSEPPGSVAPWQ